MGSSAPGGPVHPPQADTDLHQSESTPASPVTAPRTVSRSRLVWVDALIGLTTVLLVLAIFATFANRVLFSPDNWANTSTQLLQNADIRSTTANYLIDQLYANVNVAGVIKSALPPRLQPLAGPAAGALRTGAVQAVELALTRPRVQNLWREANRAADQTFIAVVNGGKGPIGIKQGAVMLNLGAILDNVASRLGLPSGLASKLPPNIANLTVFKSNQLKLVQDGGNAIRSLAVWLAVAVVVLYVVALLLAGAHRRRTLMTIGFAGVLAGALVLFGRSLLESQVTSSLTHDASLQATIRAVISIATQILSQIATATILIAVVLIAAAWFAGPARAARAVREAIAPFLRERPAASYAITLGVMVIVFAWDPIHATGTPIGIIVFTALALLGTTILIRQTAREFPDARPGAAIQAIRARSERIRRHREAARLAQPAQAATVAGQLAQLAALRDSGAITAEEFQSAKAAVLKG